MQAPKREIAEQVLTDALAAHRGRVEIAKVIAVGATRGVSLRTLQRTAAALGVTTVHNGCRPGFWLMYR